MKLVMKEQSYSAVRLLNCFTDFDIAWSSGGIISLSIDCWCINVKALRSKSQEIKIRSSLSTSPPKSYRPRREPVVHFWWCSLLLLMFSNWFADYFSWIQQYKKTENPKTPRMITLQYKTMIVILNIKVFFLLKSQIVRHTLMILLKQHSHTCLFINSELTERIWRFVEKYKSL